MVQRMLFAQDQAQLQILQTPTLFSHFLKTNRSNKKFGGAHKHTPDMIGLLTLPAELS